MRRLLGRSPRTLGRNPGAVTNGQDAQALASLGVPLPASLRDRDGETPDCLVAENEHGRYCVPRSSLHRPVARAILSSRVWEAKTLKLMRESDPSGDVIHAGTFFGDFVPALARSRSAGAIVWAFEPNRESHRCAELTIALNDLHNVVLTHAGLDAAGGSALLEVSDRMGVALGGGSHLLEDPADAGGRDSEQVRLVAIDEVVGADRHVAVIQLDVEGHERQALEGAIATIERCRPVIVLETLPAREWIAERLEPLGYRVGRRLDENTVLSPR